MVHVATVALSPAQPIPLTRKHCTKPLQERSRKVQQFTLTSIGHITDVGVSSIAPANMLALEISRRI